MVTRILDRKVTDSKPLCILFLYLQVHRCTLRFQTMNFDATFGIVPSCFSQAFAVSIYLTIKGMLGIHKVEYT